MKKELLETFVIIGFMLFVAFSCKSNQSNYSDEQAISMLESFYKSYITENAKSPPEFSQSRIDSLKEKYCTSKLLMKIENKFKQGKLDYDPFLYAQDSRKELLKTLNIKKYHEKDNLYSVSYTDQYYDTKFIINLIVIKQDDYYKIDSIIDSKTKEVRQVQ